MTRPASPVPLPDEFLISFLIRGERLHGRDSTVSQLALRNHRIWTTPYGHNHHHRRVWDFVKSLRTGASELESLSFLDFFQPFERNGYSRRPCRGRRLSYERVTRRHLGSLKSRLAFCPLCTQEDCEQLGISYWRRTHQVRCNEVCEKHLYLLLDTCPHCDRPFPELELPQPSCRLCGGDLIDTSIHPEKLQEPIEELLRIAVASRLLVTGAVRQSLDLDQVRRVVRQRVRCRVPRRFNNVARFVLERLGRDRLDRLGIHPWKAPTLGWPAIYLSGRWPNASSLIELVLFGLFGDDNHVHSYWTGPGELIAANPHRPALQLDLGFLRNMYRAKSWGEAYENAGLSPSHASNICSAYPGLKQRIEDFRRRRSTRRLRRHC